MKYYTFTIHRTDYIQSSQSYNSQEEAQKALDDLLDTLKSYGFLFSGFVHFV